MQDIDLVNAKHLKYLGVWISYDRFSAGDKQSEHGISCSRSSFAQHRKLVQNKNINVNNRVIY